MDGARHVHAPAAGKRTGPCPYCGHAIELTDEDVVRGDVATCRGCDRDSRIKRDEGEKARFSITLVPLDE